MFPTEGPINAAVAVGDKLTHVDEVGACSGVNKKPKKFKTVWHGIRGTSKLSGRDNQASLKLSA